MAKITPKEIALRQTIQPDGTENLVKIFGLQMYQQAIEDVIRNSQKFDIQGNQVLLVIDGTFFRQMQSGNTYSIEQGIK
jgi:hypothetical protein